MAPLRFFGVGLVILCLADAVIALTPTPPPEATPTSCHLLGGVGAISDVTVEPGMPLVVGDTAPIRFEIRFVGYSRDQVRLEGGEALLDGNRSVFTGPFEMLAIAPGSATIELAFSYRTEYRCGDIFYPGPDMEARSEAVTFQIVVPSPTPTPTTKPEPVSCAGDCAGDGAVTIDELVKAVAMSTGQIPASECSVTDGNADGRVTITELVTAVGASLYGCDSGSVG